MNIFEYFEKIDRMNDEEFNAFMESMGAPNIKVYDTNIDISEIIIVTNTVKPVDGPYNNVWEVSSNNCFERNAA